MKTVCAFLGVSNGKSKGIYSLLLYVDGKAMSLPEKIVERNGNPIGPEYIALCALEKLVDGLANVSEGISLYYYSGIKNFSEYYEGKRNFPNDNLVATIKEKAMEARIEINIIEDSNLFAINKLESLKAKSGRNR